MKTQKRRLMWHGMFLLLLGLITGLLERRFTNVRMGRSAFRTASLLPLPSTYDDSQVFGPPVCRVPHSPTFPQVSRKGLARRIVGAAAQTKCAARVLKLLLTFLLNTVTLIINLFRPLFLPAATVE